VRIAAHGGVALVQTEEPSVYAERTVPLRAKVKGEASWCPASRHDYGEAVAVAAFSRDGGKLK